MLEAALVLSYALTSSDPLYLREQGPPYKDLGVRIELNKELDEGFFWELNPYVWKSNGQTAFGVGGVEARLGWHNNRFQVNLFHKSEHNFDRRTQNDQFINVNAAELKINLN